MFIQNGVTHIVCTPHSSEHFKFDPALNLERLEMIRQRLGNRITLGLGCDFHLMFDNIEDAIANPAKGSINGKQYLLVEFPDHGISQNMKEIFFRLSTAGLTWMIRLIPSATRCSHATLNAWRIGSARAAASADHRCVADRPLWQSGAACLPPVAAAELGVNFLATDAHDLQSRPPMLRNTYELVSDKYWGQDRRPAVSAQSSLPVSGRPSRLSPNRKACIRSWTRSTPQGC